MPPKRAHYVMVAEDDPQWMRFWAAYPHCVAKKEARKAWAELNPTPAMVDQMLAALEWQVPLWTRQGYGTPYPASWIRAERWSDQPPRNGNGKHAPVFTEWECPHVDEHASRSTCEIATKLGRPRKDSASAT